VLLPKEVILERGRKGFGFQCPKNIKEEKKKSMKLPRKGKES